MRYNTGNPVEPDGSDSPFDLHDNSANMDLALNRLDPVWVDRLGRPRKSWFGIEQQVNDYLASQGYEPVPLDYVDGTPLTVDRPTQLVQRDGNLYSVKLPASFPVTLSGTWVDDQDLLVTQVDRSLRQQLSDENDLSLGAAMVGRAVRHLKSIRLAAGSADGELRSVAGRYDGDIVYVEGFWDDITGDGGGTFEWIAASTAAEVPGMIEKPAGVINGRWHRQYEKGSVNPTWFGARSGEDSTAALQACFAWGENIKYSPGHWIHSLVDGLQKLEGQAEYGVGGHRFGTRPTLLTKLECTASGGIWSYFQDTNEVVQRSGPSMYDCYVLADNGIRIGDINTLITAQSLSMKPDIQGNIFQARTPGSGRGLTMVGCFDHNVSLNEFRQFDIHVATVGNDIGDIHNNRTSFHGSYAFLQLSAAPSFGSQEKIRNNDILVGELTSSVFIRSTSRHPRIYDNYFEQGQSRNMVKGFIDTSLQDPPVLGVNSSAASQQSVVIDANRIDGHNKCSEFLYKINPGAVSTKLWDSGADGTQTSGSAPWLLLANGEIGLRVRFNINNYCSWDISGGTGRFMQDFPQFKTKYPGSNGGVMAVDAESFACLDHGPLNADSMADHVRLSPKSFALLPSAGTNWLHMVPEPANDINNDIFRSGVSYTVEIIARCTIAGEQLYVGRSSGSGAAAGDVSTAKTLTTQYSKFTSTLTGQSGAAIVGVALRRSAINSGIVHIKSIVVKEA